MAEQQKQKNALITMVNAKKASAWQLRASYMPTINMDVYFKRALIDIMGRKELLPISKTEIGAASIMNCIIDAVQMGLQIGGNIPQAYITPFGEKAELIPTAEGYRFITTVNTAREGEKPNNLLNNFSIRAVYDGENFSLDYHEAAVKHTYDGRTPRGKLIGVYVIIEEITGRRRIEYMTRAEIESVRDTKSRYFMSQKKGPWKDDFDAMCLKTAAKRFLKPYAAMKEGLAMVLAVDDGDPIQDKRPIQDRVGEHLDDVIDADYETTGELGESQGEEPKVAQSAAGTQGSETQGSNPQGGNKKKAPF